MTDKFKYLIEGFRLFCLGCRPQYMCVGEHGIEKRAVLRGVSDVLTVLQFKSGRDARSQLARFKQVGYDGGALSVVEVERVVAESEVRKQTAA
jgi:hypothetical protein